MRGGDVEKHDFVGALVVVISGVFDDVARVGERNEVHALDHPSVLDVQAGNDALAELIFHMLSPL